MSPLVRHQLVEAGAKEKRLSGKDFVGLAPGQTFYAYDPATDTYWAGAALVPDPASTPALVSIQDNGGYTLFKRTAGSPWQAYDVAMTGTPGSRCLLDVPAGVLRVWGWPPHSCRPGGRP